MLPRAKQMCEMITREIERQSRMLEVTPMSKVVFEVPIGRRNGVPLKVITGITLDNEAKESD